MENGSFKTVAFGGFDRQDVVAYIERAAQEAAAVQARLQQENDSLQAEARQLASRLKEAQESLAQAESRLWTMEEEQAQLRAELDRETAQRCELEALRPQLEQLSAEVGSLRADAGAYARFREQIGSIECEARQRAAQLEDETGRRLRQAAERFRAQYQAMMETFEATASHVNGELRKIEVTLTQLPRAMDQSGADLEALSSLLEEGGARQERG